MFFQSAIYKKIRNGLEGFSGYIEMSYKPNSRILFPSLQGWYTNIRISLTLAGRVLDSLIPKLEPVIVFMFYVFLFCFYILISFA